MQDKENIMMPIILASSDEKKITDFLDRFKKTENISQSNILSFYPKNKEFSIDQIKEIRKNAIFNTSSRQLFLLYSFDTASLEAQNAFLKTLEEKSEKIQFVLVVKQFRHLTPTILSRSKIIDLNDRLKDTEEHKNTKIIEEFLKTGDLKILSNKEISIKSRTPIEIIDELISFFKRKIESDTSSPKILKEIILTRFHIENNNLDSQLAIDHLLLYIKKAYLTRKSNL